MVRRFWAPGRVNLIGEHTDYSGGLVLPAAIELGTTVEVDVAPATTVTSEDGDPSAYVAAVEAELAAAGRPDVRIAGRVVSTLPIGAGLSSSAALEVAVAVALCGVADFEVESLELARVAQRAEHRASGVPCGLMDQAASVLGRAGHAILLDTGTLEHRPVRLPPDVALVVVDSGVRRRLKDSAYHERRRELEEASAGGTDPVHVRRLRHVTTENERVRAVVAALERTPPDLESLGRLFREGHESLRVDFEVSTPEIDLLVDLAYENGAVAARLTGAGFGGSIVALVRRGDVARLAASVVEAYDARGGPRATVYVTAAGDGAREL